MIKTYLLLSWVLLCLLVAPAQGQENPSLPDAGALHHLIEVLEDDQSRSKLLDHLRSASGATTAGLTTEMEPADHAAPAVDADAENADESSGLVAAILNWFSQLLETLPTITFGVTPAEMFQQAWADVQGRVAFGLQNGALVGWALWAIPALLAAAVIAATLPGTTEKLARVGEPGRFKRLATAITLQIVATAVLFLFAALLVWVISPSRAGGDYFLILCAGMLAALLGWNLLMSLMLGLTWMRGHRLIRYCRERFRPWLLVSLSLAVAALVFGSTESQRVSGKAAAEVAGFICNMLAAIVTSVFISHERLAIGKLVFGRRLYNSGSGHAVQLAVHQLARRWHLFAYAFLLLSLVSLFAGSRSNGVPGQVLSSFGVVLAALTGAALIRAFLIRSENRRRRARRTIRAALSWGFLVLLGLAVDAALVIGVIVIVASIWGLDVWPWMMTEGQHFISPAVAAGTCAAIAWLVWIAVDTWINGVLNPIDAFGRFRQRSNRTQTLLPLARSGLLILILVVTTLAMLTNLGVNVTPLIAGAGVFGIALSFGSQQLVQDVITGLFILAEDTIAIGETINTGDRTGVVEGLSLRTVRLRDADGALHSIPFSTIKALKNSSRNYSVFRPRYSVPSGVNPEDVLTAMRDTAKLLQGDPRYSPSITGDLHNLGVEEVNIGSVVVSGSLRTIPHRQTELVRAFNGTMLESLREKGVTL